MEEEEVPRIDEPRVLSRVPCEGRDGRKCPIVGKASYSRCIDCRYRMVRLPSTPIAASPIPDRERARLRELGIRMCDS